MSKRAYSDDLDNNSQKSHYFVVPRKRSKHKSYVPSIFAKLLNTKQKHLTPFIRLFNGKESDEEITKRYNLYEQQWNQQQKTVQEILNSTNIQLFENLAKYILSSSSKKDISGIGSKLSVGLLSLSSNKANNFRLLDDFNEYLRSQRDDTRRENVKIITLSSKSCANIKSALREAIRQFFRGESEEDNLEENDEIEVEKSDDSSDNESEEEINESKSESKKSEKKRQSIDFEAGLSYDFDVIENWCNEFYINEKSDRSSTKLRITIVLRDADSVSTQVLNQLIKVLGSYTKSFPIRLILGLSTKKSSEWINMNLNNEVRMSIEAVNFKSKSNFSLGITILNEMFLSVKKGSDTLAAHPRLASILLNRFENANNSIDSMVYSIKLCYMIHFYQSPLSVLLDGSLQLSKQHFSALRKLPSFKAYIEKKLFNYQVTKRKYEREKDRAALISDKMSSTKMTEISMELSLLKNEIKDLFDHDHSLSELLKKSRIHFSEYRTSVNNLVNVLYQLQFDHEKSQFEIYKLITSNEMLNSEFIKNLTKDIKQNSNEIVFAKVQSLLMSKIERNGDETIDELFTSLSCLSNDISLNSNILLKLKNYLDNQHFRMSMDDNLFYEIFTLDGGISLSDEKHYVEDNFNNLMLDLIRPNARHVIETGLENPDSYLKDELVTQEIKKIGNSHPIISLLFNLYKDAPASINIYDFYVAFRSSLNKDRIGEEFLENIALYEGSDKDSLLEVVHNLAYNWDKLTFAWFIQSCYELISIGFLKEKTRGDYLEKAIWKGI